MSQEHLDIPEHRVTLSTTDRGRGGEVRLAIFASGSGTNAEQIMKHFQRHEQIGVALVLSNNVNAFVLERAKKFNVPSKIFSRTQLRESLDVLQWLTENQISHIVLAGFMWLMPTSIIQQYPNRIINIHPALLPKFGGKGMYGHYVHEAVKSAGEKETGITIHMVNEKYDEGRILFQTACAIEPNDTPDKIAEKVHTLEYQHYPEQIEKWVLNQSEVSIG